MKSIAPIVLLCLLSVSAWAQNSPRDPVRHRYQENLSYGYATVMRVQPAYETYASSEGPRCFERRSSRRGTGGAVLGAIVGGALGNQGGKGDGRKAATVAGAVAGGVIGHRVSERNGATTYECPDGYIQEQPRIVGYDVEYRYKGESYMSRLPFDPGNRLRVRVSVTPDDGR